MIINPFSSSSSGVFVGTAAQLWKPSHPFFHPRRQERNSNDDDNNNNNNKKNKIIDSDMNDNDDDDDDDRNAKYDKNKRQWKRQQQRRRRAGFGSLNPNIVVLVWLITISLLAGMVFFGGRALVVWWAQYEDPDVRVARHRYQRAKFEMESSTRNKAQRHHNAPKLQHDDTISLAVVSREQHDMSPADIKHDVKNMSTTDLLQLFDKLRPKHPSEQQLTKVDRALLIPILKEWARRLDSDIRTNHAGGVRWIRPYLLPPLPGIQRHGAEELVHTPEYQHDQEPPEFFKKSHEKELAKGKGLFRGSREVMDVSTSWQWEQEWDQIQKEHQDAQQQQQTEETNGRNEEEHNKKKRIQIPPPVDYTDPIKYQYPPLMDEPPLTLGGYPAVKSLGQLMKDWPQNEDKYGTIHEVLMHFNYSNPLERKMAQNFRDAKLPFKVYDIPDIDYVVQKWSDDDYIHQEFDTSNGEGYTADGLCQESPNHFFAFFVPPLWQTTVFGIPPVSNNDWTYQRWSEHAKYADATALAADRPHYYWQSGVMKSERFNKSPRKQSFISRDLNATLGATEDNFFVFNVKEQKGIQCRFGERGVTAATHFDAGQNMIAMLTGAKRYILSPPNACSQLGVFNRRDSPIFRHSLLNFDHLQYLNETLDQQRTSGDGDNLVNGGGGSGSSSTMSQEERNWLLRASEAPALETVLKQGEVLFLPSFWFHYIVSVQKSAQCNVRSGIDQTDHFEWGGISDINQCAEEGVDQEDIKKY